LRTADRGRANGLILCLGTTPAAQRVMVFHRLELDAVNRACRTLDGVAGKSINVVKVLHAVGARRAEEGSCRTSRALSSGQEGLGGRNKQG
jgi:hypothetical protein